MSASDDHSSLDRATDTLVRRLSSIGTLSQDDAAALAELPVRREFVQTNVDLINQGAVPTVSCLLIDGFLCRYHLLPEGKRQILSIHCAGEIPDLQNLYLSYMDHTLASVVPSEVGFIAHKDLRELIRARPHVCELLWRETLIDAAIFRQSIISLGRRTARERVGHLLCELFVRQRVIDNPPRNACRLPLTQTQLADLLGLSLVHVNRTLQGLRADGLVELEGRLLVIHDWEGLQEVSAFDPAYLQLDDPV